MIDVLERDGLLALSDATRILPRVGGKRPHTSTIWRWCRVGVKSRSGQRIQLEHVRIGARVFTTHAAINDFVAAVAAADSAHFNSEHSTPPKAPSDTQRERSIQQAERTLTAGGIL